MPKPERSPQVIVLAGPNGAGKSTSAPALLRGTLGVTEFVNADVIARGLSGFAPDGVAFEAGGIMLKRLRDLASARTDFAFETTLAARSLAPWIAGLCGNGYVFRLVYFWLPSPDLAVARVASRVAHGGHDVPEATVRRRYFAGLRNFLQLYRPLATSWLCFDNSNGRNPYLVAAGRGTIETTVLDDASWRTILEMAGHA
ncbi:MAG TPA: AAA family ATPase [Pirellulales bacterium]|nr:AAA family ATPase [Pirellulales bacterium]